MFYLRREREERAKGRSERAALEAAAATSGRSVLISGLTVMVAMAGMFVTGDKTFASFGVATMMVVAVAMLGSLTVLPALLSRLGDSVDRLPRPAPPQQRRRGPHVGLDRRPRPAAAGARPRRSPAARCSCSPCPRSRCGWRTPRRTRSRRSLEVVKTYKRMQQAFPGTALPANVIVKAQNVNAPAVRDGDLAARAAGARERPRARADHDGRQSRPARSRTSRSRSTATAATRRRTRRWSSSARRSSRRRSARSRTRRPASPG